MSAHFMSFRTDKLFTQTFQLHNGSLLKVFAFRHLLVKTTPTVARMLFVKFSPDASTVVVHRGYGDTGLIEIFAKLQAATESR